MQHTHTLYSLPRMTHLPPLEDNCIQINISPHRPHTDTTPITHTDTTPITRTDITPITRTNTTPIAHTDATPQEPVKSNSLRLLSSKRPRPKGRNVISPDSADSELPRLNLNLSYEIGLDDPFGFSEC